MKPEEIITEKYLKSLEIGNVIFEPDGNIPPDFKINNQIGIEVQRLNQYFFKGNKPEALEQLDFPIWDAFTESLNSFDQHFQGKTYFVALRYERPLESNIKVIKAQMKHALTSFLVQNLETPAEMQVNEQVNFYIGKAKTSNGRLFLAAGKADMDAGGFIVSNYIENINLCIQEKNLKVNSVSQNYKEWWLLLVDTLGWGLDQNDILEVKNHLHTLGHFHQLILIAWNGQFLMNA